MKTKVMLTGWLFILMSVVANATIIYIPEDQPTIQLGLNSANSGDTVLVSPGIYYENIIWPGINGIVLLSESGAEQTIIDGNNVSYTIKLQDYYNIIDTITVIDGFTVCNGEGGGIYARHTSPTIQNCIIENNTSSSYGGGIFHYHMGSKAIIRNNIIRNNSASDGGGISLGCSETDVYGNKIYNNSASFGGGIFCGKSYNFIRDNEIYNNTSSFGGGICCYEVGSLIIEGNNIHHNTANQGGGISSDGMTVIINNQIHHNESLGDGGGVYAWYCIDEITLHQNDIFQNSAANHGAGLFADSYSDTLNAEDNWWGDASGPYNEQLNPDGTGNEVYGDADFIPWATEPFFGYNGPVWHIATWGDDETGDGSADNPFATIQHGIDMSTDGDTVLVNEGTYYENINFLGKKIVVTSYYYLTDDSTSIYNTIIDGSYPSNPDSGSVVVFASGEDSLSIISGFTIQNGSGTQCSGRFGGGIYCNNSSPLITDNIIVSNTAFEGGGIYTDSPGTAHAPKISNSKIKWNSATGFGGGIYVDGSMVLTDNVITGNCASYGGGIGSQFGCYNTIILTRNKILNNQSSDGHGGGFWMDKAGTVVEFRYNLVCNNNGGGIVILDYDYSSDITLINNTICDNNGKGVHLGVGDFVAINNIICSNDIGIDGWAFNQYQIDYNDVWNNPDGNYINCVPGVGNISDDPLFVGGVPFDYHLTEDSPCIDAGDPNSPLDPDSTRADIGAYYFDQTQTGISNIPIPRLRFMLYQNYPNPFNPTTKIQYSIPIDCKVELKIYNIKGELVRTLVNEPQSAGYYKVIWNGKDYNNIPVSSGIYFYRLKVDDKVIDTKKCLLLK